MTKVIDVVAAAVVRNDRVLAARRGPQMSLASLWEFPGGKTEPRETPQAALRREFREELGCSIRVGRQINTTRHLYEFGLVVLSSFYAEIDSGEPIPTEHSELKWCTASELAELDWAPADLPAVESVIASLDAVKLRFPRTKSDLRP